MGAVEDDSLQVPSEKKRKPKSPTPSTLRGRSSTPVGAHGRSQTPFTLYLSQHSATPSTFRSITPFLNREEKEKTPFELGHDIKTQITCNKAVFDKALIMDVSESEDAQKPVRYITSDLSVIDRACVMDVSNVEIIYVVEEYEEPEPQEPAEDEKAKRKSSRSRREKPKRSVEKGQSPSGHTSETEEAPEPSAEPEQAPAEEEGEETTKKGKKKSGKKKDRKEHSPSPQLTLKLELGGGTKANKKMFEAASKPPTKKQRLLEEKAKAAAAKAAAKAAAEAEAKRLKAEQEAKARREAELKAQREAEEAAAAAAAAEAAAAAAAEEEAQWNEDYDEYGDYDEYAEVEEEPVKEPTPEPENKDLWEDHVWNNPDDEEFWAAMGKREGVDFMHHVRNYAYAKRLSRQTEDDDWERRRDEAVYPRFVVFLADRSVPVGQNLRLACAVDGVQLVVHWYRDGRRLKDDNNHQIDDTDNIMSLTLINPSEVHSGEYKCVVENRYDEITTACIVTVYVVYKREPKPPVVKFVREKFHLRDDEYMLECHVTGVPRPKITWLRGKFQIVQNKTFTPIEEAHGVCKLLIFRPANKDSGVYTCKAVNDSGSAQVNHTVEIARNLHYHMEEQERLRLKRLEESKAEMEAFYRAQRSSPEPVIPPKRKLKFATQLRDRMALIGSTVKFVCTIIGPSPSCRWTKDDQPISLSPTVRDLSEEGKAILELAKVMPESSGVYKCIAKNKFCEIDTSCYFKVYSAQAPGDEQAPRFALPLKDMYHVTRNDLTVETKVRGNPRPTITWIKDGKVIQIDERIDQIQHLDGHCELIIHEPTLEEAGIYTCVAENKLGSVKIVHEVVLDDYPELQPGIPKEPKKEGEGEGEGAEPTQEAEAAPVPEKKEEPPKVEATGGAGGAGGAEGAEGEGEAGAEAEPEEEKKEEEELYERRSRAPEPAVPHLKQALHFTVHLTNRYVTEGSKVKLQAVVDGPSPSIRWKKDDESISYSSRVKNTSREGLAILEFTNVLPEDAGTYTIIAQNEFDKITSSAMLQVLQPTTNMDEEPVFVKSLKDTYHLVANELKLETCIHGHPPPQIQWFKDNVLIENGGRYEIVQHLDGTCELSITHPTADDSGKYIVKAESRAGNSEVCHLVLFEGIETHIAENIHGAFHADKSLLRPKPEEEEEGDAYPPPEPYEAPPMPPLPTAEPAKEEPKAEEPKAEEPKADEPKPEEGATAEAPPEEEQPAAVESPLDKALKKREIVIPIHFVTLIQDRYAAEGSKVKFSCILEGKEPIVKWYKGEEQLSNSSKIKYKNADGLLTLEISKLTLEDNGEYICSARDETGKVSCSGNLKVYVLPKSADKPPTFTRYIRESYHAMLDELQLDTHVRGPPTPTIIWLRDGLQIKPSAKFEQIDHDDGTCELNILHPKPEDGGNYICQAMNSGGGSEISHKVVIKPHLSRPKLPVRQVVEEEPEVVEAGEDAKPDETEQKTEEGAKDEAAESSYGSRREVIPVPDHKKYLYLRNYLTNRTVQEGGTVKWMVYIDGPQPSARWYHGEDPVPFSPKVRMLLQDGLASMTIIGVEKEDAGEYTLKVRGSENEIESSCTLTVYSVGQEEKPVPPSFVVGINDVYSLTENQLVLDCRVSGKPKPTIQWRKDNAIIRMSQKYEQVDQADGYCKLIIKNPSVNDSGVYSCVARNEAAEHALTHEVNFEGSGVVATEKVHGFFHRDPNKPRFVGPLGNQMVRPGGTIVITAEFMPSATPIEVQWYRNHQVLSVQPEVKIFRDKGLYILAILNASAAEEGTYTCAATNEYGTVEAHATVDVASDALDDELPPLFLARPNRKMNIALGDPFSLSFRIADEPRPKLTFFKELTDITKSDRVTKEKDISDDSMRFTVHESQISDCGTYFVVARNKFGTDRIFVSITVKTPTEEEK